MTDTVLEGRAHLTEMLREEPERLRRRSISLGVHPNDADDVAQNAALRAWRAVDDLRATDRGTMCSWLDAIARTAAADLSRRERVRQTDGQVKCDSLEHPERTEESAELHDSLVRALEAIRALPETLREPLMLSVVDELSAREIAERLGISPATVRQRVSRARRSLRG